ncbi:MAG: hypothetical protein L3J16_03985, partial [Anaerolineales bacterium]|nr:hypothetical protein [Anaerolineales bacterium]
MSRKILIFDMDGVLLRPRGYHQALQDTGRFGAQALGFDNVTISDTEIAQFEGLGISSEWHSSAACMALLTLYGELAFSPLFMYLKRVPSHVTAFLRLEKAVQDMAEAEEVEPAQAVSFIRKSQTLQSTTFRIFQELILGTKDFTRIYGEQGTLDVESYLLRFDESLLGSDARERLLAWLEDPRHGCVIMTNRPSNKMPDAEYGRRLVGLDAIPLIGNNDIGWLAEQVGEETAALLKPAPVHALAATLVALGRPREASLREAYAVMQGSGMEAESIRLWVFEDTPAGLVSVNAMREIFRRQGISIEVTKIGIATSVNKGE